MGKQVKVKVTGAKGMVYRDLTEGDVYDAYLPERGERDYCGLQVVYHDELWIHVDDAGDRVVGQLSDGFTIVDTVL